MPATARPTQRRRQRGPLTGKPELRPGGYGLQTAVACTILVAMACAVYAPVRHFGFVNWDDATYVVDNPQVRAGLTWTGLRWALTTGHAPYWHPLTWLSHMVDVSLFGLDAGAFHVVNVAIHALNSMLVFLWWRSATKATLASFFAGVLFAVHPLHVESVAWIAERKDLVSSAFLLLSLASYLSYVRGGHYLLVLATYCLALMSKPMVVTFPVLLLLLDFWPLRRVTAADDSARWWPLLREKVPLLALAAAASVVTVAIQARVGALPIVGRITWSGRFANIVVGYARYLWMTVWPVNLGAYYPLRGWSASVIGLAGGLLAVLTIACFLGRRRYPFLLIGWLWFLVGLAPVSGVVQAGGQSVADRFVYLPLVGLLVAVVWGAIGLLEGRSERMSRLAAALVALIVIGAAVLARGQVMTWADSETLWRHVLTVTEPSSRAYENLGQALRDKGEFNDAIAAYEKAIAVPQGPGDASSPAQLRDSLGITLVQAGQTAAAAAELEKAAQLDPALPEIRVNLGNVLASLGNFAAAEPQFREAIRLDPEIAEPRVGLGNVCLERGDLDEAVSEYREAVRLAPRLAQAHSGLAGGLAAQGALDAAIAEYRVALGLDPNSFTAHLNLGLVLAREGKAAAAISEVETAQRLDPSSIAARQALASLRRSRQ